MRLLSSQLGARRAAWGWVACPNRGFQAQFLGCQRFAKEFVSSFSQEMLELEVDGFLSCCPSCPSCPSSYLGIKCKSWYNSITYFKLVQHAMTWCSMVYSVHIYIIRNVYIYIYVCVWHIELRMKTSLVFWGRWLETTKDHPWALALWSRR